MSDTKIYRIYRKRTNELYAYSLYKKKVTEFLEQRNADVFYVKSEKVPEAFAAAFMSKHQDRLLTDITLSDVDGDYTLVGTYYEDRQLDDSCEYIASELDHILTLFLALGKYRTPLKKEYLQAIQKACTCSKITKYQNEIEIDTLKLFYTIHRFSFLGEEENDRLMEIEKEESHIDGLSNA